MTKRRMILGLSHDTCPVCGKDIQMRNDRKLYHHGHPARRCPGAGGLGIRMAKFMADARFDDPGGDSAPEPERTMAKAEPCADPVRGEPKGWFQVSCADCWWRSNIFRTAGEVSLALTDHRLTRHSDGDEGDG